MKTYKLLKDVLWHKKGTKFEIPDDGSPMFVVYPNGERMITFDRLQCAIAEHFGDEGAEKYFEKLNLVVKK